MSLILKLDSLRPELMLIALSAAWTPPPAKELELARDKVKQIKLRKYRLLPADIHRANTIMQVKGKPAYDLFLQEESERFEERRAQDLDEAMTTLAAMELSLERSTTEGILVYALELGLRKLAADA